MYATPSDELVARYGRIRAEKWINELMPEVGHYRQWDECLEACEELAEEFPPLLMSYFVCKPDGLAKICPNLGAVYEWLTGQDPQGYLERLLIKQSEQ